MTYFKDLSDYSYHPSGVGNSVKNVGWIDGSYSVGVHVNSCQKQELIDKLLELWEKRVVKTRGFHSCELCENPAMPSTYVSESKQVFNLGSAEFRVEASTTGEVYAAPDLIVHYISEHDYQPPSSFVEALGLDAEIGTR